MTCYLGVDVGGTTIAAALADGDTGVAGGRTTGSELLGEAETETPATGSRAVTDAVLDTVGRACAAAGREPPDVAAAAVGCVGPLDREAGAIDGPANVGGSEPITLVEPLRDRLETDDVALYNDATCGALAEYAAASVENLVYLTLSTGIGAGVIADGAVLGGADGNAGEVGHTTVDPEGRMRCGCGGAGHWEAYAGGANVPRYAEWIHREESVETALPVGTGALTAADVFDAAGEDELANRVVERVGRWNAIGVANVVQAFAPETVVIGGGVAVNNPDAVLGPIRRGVPDRVLFDAAEIRLTEFGGEVVLYGAVRAATEGG